MLFLINKYQKIMYECI